MSKIDVHKRICEELNALYARKNADYGDSFGKSFKEYGLTMACIRLEDKLNRIKALRNKDAQVADESITDTLMDLANYSIMTLVEMRCVQNQIEQIIPRGIHEEVCAKRHPHCQCLSCARDNSGDEEELDELCCTRHGAMRCPADGCPDYVPEEG